MPTDTKPSPDVHAQLEQAAAEVDDLERQLSDLAAANKVTELAPIVDQLQEKRGWLDRARTVVSALNVASAAKERAEQERQQQAEAERQRQARLALEVQRAGLERALTEAWGSAEDSIGRLHLAIADTTAIAAQMEALSIQLGDRVSGAWRHEAVRQIIDRGRYVLRLEADALAVGLGNQLFASDGTTRGHEPLVKFLEAES